MVPVAELIWLSMTASLPVASGRPALVAAVTYVLVNLLVDVAYAAVDPRIRFG